MVVNLWFHCNSDVVIGGIKYSLYPCLLYTSDAADDRYKV